jgi:hypothetical protein
MIFFILVGAAVLGIILVFLFKISFPNLHVFWAVSISALIILVLLVILVVFLLYIGSHAAGGP